MLAARDLHTHQRWELITEHHQTLWDWAHNPQAANTWDRYIVSKHLSCTPNEFAEAWLAHEPARVEEYLKHLIYLFATNYNNTDPWTEFPTFLLQALHGGTPQVLVNNYTQYTDFIEEISKLIREAQSTTKN